MNSRQVYHKLPRARNKRSDAVFQGAACGLVKSNVQSDLAFILICWVTRVV
jgi:hypothetical protein